MSVNQLLVSLLAIKSPTYSEQACIEFCEQWIVEHTSFKTRRIGDNLIAESNIDGNKPHFSFVGHLDVVPDHFEPIEDNDKIYGAGASDMKGGVAAFLWFIHQYESALSQHYHISVILYAREEGTPIKENGLYEIIQQEAKFLKSIDLAIIAEPTNNTIQLGCVGSIHAAITVKGKSSHSARPWDGDNALYKALPVIQYFADQVPVAHQVSGVTFSDVISITESQCQPGRTTIPGEWTANVNFRYAPVHQDPEAVLMQHCNLAGVNRDCVVIKDHVPAGSVIDTAVFKQIMSQLNQPIEAKQAWTDVAQLTAMGVAAFNFGPGLTSQAHLPNEYINVKMIEAYIDYLKRLIKE